MPLFHFHLVTTDEREHIGTLDLPEHNRSMTGGVYLTMRVLSDIILTDHADGGLTLRATDESGAIVHDLHVPRRSDDGQKSDSDLHHMRGEDSSGPAIMD